jgi:hypothetical protein
MLLPDIKLLVKETAQRLGKVDESVHECDYTRTIKVKLSCQLTKQVYQFSFFKGTTSSYVIFELNKAEDQLLRERGKHLIKAYKFYEPDFSKMPLGGSKSASVIYEELLDSHYGATAGYTSTQETIAEDRVEKENLYRDNEDYGQF